MNQKILNQLILDLGKGEINADYVKDTFDIEITKSYNNINEWADAIDDAILHRYFSKVWQSDMKKWKHSGLQLIDEVNNLRPRNVLDVGCGYNEFKGKINFLTGIDPYNDEADILIKTIDYTPKQKFELWLKQAKKEQVLLDDGVTTTERLVSRCTKTDREIPLSEYMDSTKWQADHIIEVADGGETTIENGQLIAVDAHSEKTVENQRRRLQEKRDKIKSSLENHFQEEVAA